MHVDYLIVGSGLTGAVIGRLLHDAGKRVLIVERRSSVGGNVHDHTHESGIRIHTYGPHYFRTSAEDVWRFLNRFATFYRYEACVKSHVDGRYENWPIAASYIRRTIGEDWRPEYTGRRTNLEEAALSLMPRQIYELFVKEYNEKQWGVPATALSTDLCTRFDVRQDDDPRLMPRHIWQGLPTEGYSKMMERMLAGIPLLLNVDYLEHRTAFTPRVITIYTGPIDAYFGYKLGRLAYRGQRRITTYLPHTERFQIAAQVNEPRHAAGPHIRTLEWKQMMPAHFAARIKGTVITREVPMTPTCPDGFEYPFPDERNRQLYRTYRKMADTLGDVLMCGRLGEYRYYDMDQAIARAMMLARRLLGRESASVLRQHAASLTP